MKTAHQLDASGMIINTVVVGDLDVLPNLIDATIGGSIGDHVVNGQLVPRAPLELSNDQFNAPILAALADIDARSIRPLRDGETARVAELRDQAATLRAQLRK